MKAVLVLLFTSAAIFVTLLLLTPIGGWNKLSASYNHYYRVFFNISSLVLIISLGLLFVVMERDTNKMYKEKRD